MKSIQTPHNKKNERISKNIFQIQQTFRLWLPFWSQLRDGFPPWRISFATCFLEPLGGTPLDRCWPPLGHPGSDFVTFLEDSNSKFISIFEDSRATNGTNHTSTKQVRIQTNTENQSKQLMFYFCCFVKPRKSETQSLKQIGSA